MDKVKEAKEAFKKGMIVAYNCEPTDNANKSAEQLADHRITSEKDLPDNFFESVAHEWSRTNKNDSEKRHYKAMAVFTTPSLTITAINAPIELPKAKPGRPAKTEEKES